MNKQELKINVRETKALDAVAKLRNPRCSKWYGARGGSSKRYYQCNICGTEIDTESAHYPMTKHSATAIEAHRQAHLAVLMGKKSN